MSKRVKKAVLAKSGRRSPIFGFTAPPELMAQVRRLAEIEQRSFSNMMVRLVHRALFDEIAREKGIIEEGEGEPPAPMLWDLASIEPRQAELLTWLQERTSAGAKRLKGKQ